MNRGMPSDACGASCTRITEQLRHKEPFILMQASAAGGLMGVVQSQTSYEAKLKKRARALFRRKHGSN
jgi:hypothetical protein